MPVLIGEGIPLLDRCRATSPLRHVATRTYSGGLVQSEYEIEQEERGAGKEGGRHTLKSTADSAPHPREARAR